MKKYISIDIGGTAIKYGIICENAEIILKETLRTEAWKGGPAILKKVIGIVEHLIEQTKGKISGICISTAGMVDTKSGSIFYSAPAIRIYFTGFLFLGINMVFICYFQSVAKSVQSLSLCLLRGCILVVAFVYILPVFFGSTGIWLAFPAAEFLTMIVGICFYRQDLKAY